jgi:ActR/RegA family two-component response regulator
VKHQACVGSSLILEVEAMRLGAADYLIKPAMLDDLERLIRETLLKGKGGHQEGEGVSLL